MCDDCRARWMAALDSRPPAPPIVLMTCGNADPEHIGRKALQRADDHWARVRDYQDQIQRECAEQHSP